MTPIDVSQESGFAPQTGADILRRIEFLRELDTQVETEVADPALNALEQAFRRAQAESHGEEMDRAKRLLQTSGELSSFSLNLASRAKQLEDENTERRKRNGEATTAEESERNGRVAGAILASTHLRELVGGTDSLLARISARNAR